jgi:hypothetical protein
MGGNTHAIPIRGIRAPRIAAAAYKYDLWSKANFSRLCEP